MLQQTQVKTALAYYARFMRRFPDVRALARADEDAVLHAWAGLGYYTRARNLHRAARQIAAAGGALPADFAAWQALPGIGRSTAGAIMALAFHQRYPILDGNVRRVLSRHFALDAPTLPQMWQLADDLTPRRRVADYTQAIMDFGATHCTRSAPACLHCPMQRTCLAFQQGRVAALPAARRAAPKPQRSVLALILRDKTGRILLERREQPGVWRGLWSLPELPMATPAEQLPALCRQRFRLRIGKPRNLAVIHHAFTHYHLQIQPCLVPVTGQTPDMPGCVWYDKHTPETIGLPAPIARLLEHS